MLLFFIAAADSDKFAQQLATLHCVRMEDNYPPTLQTIIILRNACTSTMYMYYNTSIHNVQFTRTNLKN